MRGRKPTPTVLKALAGNPGKRPLNHAEPIPPEGLPDCPEFLDEEARCEWDRIVPILNTMGLLSVADRAALAAYCSAYSRWVRAELLVQKFGEIVKSPQKGFPMKSPYLCVADQAMEAMRKFLVEFGLTPSSRSRVHLRPDFGADPLDELDRFRTVG